MKWILTIITLWTSVAAAGDFGSMQEYVSRVGKRILIVSDRPGMNYEFKVLDSFEPAMVIDYDADTIAVTRGLLQELSDEAELAAALALGIAKLADYINVDRQTAKFVAFAGYDPEALLDIQEEYFHAANANLPHWLSVIYPEPIPAGTIAANKIMIQKLPKGLQRGAESYHNAIDD